MSTNYPTSKDTLVNPTSNDTLASVSHSGQHSNANDAIEALEDKVGVNNSSDSSSIDYKLTNTSSIDPGHKHTKANITDFPTIPTALSDLSGTLDDITDGSTYVKSTNDYTDAEKTKLSGIETGAEVNNISDVNATDLTDSGASTLHYHTSDRARANHTGTQTASTISDFDTEVSNNTDVAANTSARHSAVTVTDSTEIDFTLTGQNITASLKSGSIDETKLDTSVNASLDLADSATQPGDLSTVATSGSHTDLSNIGTNTHAQIDSHISSTSNPHTVTLLQATTGGATTTVDITVGDILKIGDGTTGTNKQVLANNGDANLPALIYNESTNKWQYSNDGTTFSDMGTGGGGAVDSVNGLTGTVVLDPDDLDDTLTSHKFVTATDLTNLSNLSGTNTGDQDLSSYAKLTDIAQNITANSFITDGGTSGQFVKGDGSLDSTTYLTSLSGAVLLDQTTPQTIGDTTNRLTKLWATDITVTNAIAGSVTGNAGTVTNGIYTTSDATALAATSAGNKDKYLHSNASTGVLEWSTVTGGIDGSGTANEIPYWVDSNTLGTLAVATYPSLTELSYVKGVTSAIQTQLNAKGVGDMLLGTAQSVTAEKKFTKDKLTMLGTSTGKLIISNALTNGTDYTATFPAKTGTVAMTSDIVSQVEDSIVDGHTTIAPSGNAVFDALALKAPLTSPTFATSINGSYLTASQILGTDASKNIVSLPVATYPSLTELSYVKGVTSAIQTQLGTKIAKTTNITALNGTGIADGEIAVFNLTNKDIRTSDKTIVTTLGADDTTVPTSKAVKDVTDAKIQNSLVDAKGDLITASADNTPAILTVGTDGQSPIADSSKANGLSYFDNNSSLYRQAIINGNFDVWQRGTSFTPADVTWLHSSDHWREYHSKDGGTLPTLTRTREIEIDDNGSYYYSRLTTNGAGSSLGNSSIGQLSHLIEYGTRYLCGSGKKVTVSFEARSSIANKRLGVRLLQEYGTGGSPSSVEIINGTNWTLSSTWTKYTYTFTTNTLVGKTFGTANDDYIGIHFAYMWGSTRQAQYGSATAETYGGSGTTDIRKVQLCAGDVALPFMPKSFEEELRACQRYYEKSFEYEIAPAQNVSNYSGALWWQQVTSGATQTCYFVPFKVKKRILPPTITLYNPVAANAQVRNFNASADCTNSVVNHANGQWGFTILAVNIAGAAAGHLNTVHWSADAEL